MGFSVIADPKVEAQLFDKLRDQLQFLIDFVPEPAFGEAANKALQQSAWYKRVRSNLLHLVPGFEGISLPFLSDVLDDANRFLSAQLAANEKTWQSWMTYSRARLRRVLKAMIHNACLHASEFGACQLRSESLSGLALDHVPAKRFLDEFEIRKLILQIEDPRERYFAELSFSGATRAEIMRCLRLSTGNEFTVLRLECLASVRALYRDIYGTD